MTDRPLRVASWGCVLACLFAIGRSAAADQLPPKMPIAKAIVATRAAQPPVIDGVVNEDEWRAATPVTGFVQGEPFEGQPATERTEVRLLYDDRAIYIAAVCFDGDPSGIVVTDSRRDSSLAEMDSFEIVFDTYHDRQNGFLFGTSPNGIQYDAQVRQEGETQAVTAPTLGRVGQGSGAGLNVNWDGSWEVQAKITELGWTAEFRIPLRTLRYGPPPQLWGLNMSRYIRRKREHVYWSPVPRMYNLTRLSFAGDLTDLRVPTPRNFKLMPYLVGSADRNFAPGSRFERDGDWGIDTKFGLTSSLNLDVTYNTDFAQVEVDEQQINLTRFNLLFPEKRPFFLENRGLFAVGKDGQVDLFFSRRIGITDEGSLVPIKAGARLTGRAAGLNIGVLDMRTDRTGLTPSNNFSAIRMSKELAARSNIGGIFVNRTATGGDAAGNDWNRTWGLDGKWGVGQALTVQGFAARTETPNTAGREYAYSSTGTFRNRQVALQLGYTDIGDGFNPEVGFLERTGGYRQVEASWFQFVRSKGLADAGLRELRPHVVYDSYWDPDGFQETATLHIDSHIDWENGYYFSPAFNVQYEGLSEPFEIYPGVVVPAGFYRGLLAAWQGNTDRKKRLSFGASWNYGGFLTGHQNSLAPNVTIVQAGGRIRSVLRWIRSDIDLPQGSFVTNVGSLRLTYNFTPLVNVQSLVQYNDLTRRWSANLRFNWLHEGATGLYVVYNDTELLEGRGPVNRAFIVKYSHVIDVLR